MTKILKIDRWNIQQGQAIIMQDQRFVAIEDDYLLILSVAGIHES